MANFKESLDRVRVSIQNAAERSGRSAADITLVAVTKSVPAAVVSEAAAQGLTFFGENKVQEAAEKIPQVLAPEARWQMIGHLQSNKVKAAVSLFHLIQSVDSARLAEKIGEEAVLAGKTMDVLLEVNVSGEEQKYGFKPEAVYTALDEILAVPGIRVLGLMGMAPNASDPDLRRAAFKKLRGIFSVCKTLKRPNLDMKTLSMGMSDDFEIAIEEGSTMVRIGRALFR